MWLPLVGLAFAAFMFNTSEFMPVGLLTDIAGSFRLSEAQAGMMISIYAWAVMLLSLPLMMWSSRLPMRTLLLLVIGLFLAGQAAPAVAPTFPLLVAARLLVAAAHAVFWSIASPLATRVADDRHAATAMSMVVTGSSVAMIFGMPLGRVIGLAVGWRMTFACVGAVALCVLLLMAAVMPRLEKGEPFTLAQMPTLLRNRSLMAIYAVTILAAMELGRRRAATDPVVRDIIRSSRDVYDLLFPLLADLPHEELWALFLNRSQRIIDKQKLSQGGIAETSFDMKLLLKYAINALASGIILCHNHPSGNLRPSHADDQLTRHVAQAVKLMDMQLLDHVIIADNRYYSYSDEGKLMS